jgi:methionyl-tRNA formyltransferase
MEAAKEQLKVFTRQFIDDSIVRISQKDVISNTWRKRSKEDGEIDWRMSTINICRLINAL